MNDINNGHDRAMLATDDAAVQGRPYAASQRGRVSKAQLVKVIDAAP